MFNIKCTKKGYINDNGKIVYDPVDNSRICMIINNNFLNNEEMNEVVLQEKFIQNFYDTIFADTKPEEPIVGLQMYNLTLVDVKRFNFGTSTSEVFNPIINIYKNNGGFFPANIHLYYRNYIIEAIVKAVRTNVEYAYLRNIRGTFTPSVIQTSKKETSEILKLIESFSHRNSKISLTNYEVKFAYKTRTKPITKEDHPVFIDSEGLCHIIEPIEDTSYDEGIYIIKITNNSPVDLPYTKLKLPELGSVVKSETLGGVFISTLNEFKQIYKERFKSNFDEMYSCDCIFNIKKLVGSFLYDTVTETSHGVVSTIEGFSLSRKYFYTCSPNEGVCEIENVTPENLKKEDFVNILTEFGLTYELLTANDYIIRKTNIGSGSGNVASRKFRYEKVKVGRKTGLNDLKGSLFDNDLALFIETGLAIFTTKEAAERCMQYSGGDFNKHVHFIYNKLSQKGEKNAFMESIKNAVLLGAGAAVPKVIEMIVNSYKKGNKGDKMSIMKLMHPPMAASAISSFIPIPGFSTINKIFSLFNKGVFIMDFITIVKTVSGKVFGTCSKVTSEVLRYSKIFFTFAKNAVTTTWDLIVNFFGGVWRGVKMWFSGNYTFKEKIDNTVGGIINTGKSIVNFVKEHAANVWNTGVDLVKKTVDTVVTVTKKVFKVAIDSVKGVFGWIGGLFGKKKSETTESETSGDTQMGDFAAVAD